LAKPAELRLQRSGVADPGVRTKCLQPTRDTGLHATMNRLVEKVLAACCKSRSTCSTLLLITGPYLIPPDFAASCDDGIQASGVVSLQLCSQLCRKRAAGAAIKDLGLGQNRHAEQLGLQVQV
jgi:hypothetical protein